MKKLIMMLLLIVVIAGYTIRKAIVLPGPLLGVVNVIIPKGASSSSVAKVLEESGVIKHPLLFRIYARINGLDKHLKAGEYQFLPQVSMQEAMNKIARGEVYYRRITIPEGITSGQIMFIVASYPGLTGEVSLDIKEGELLPETYSFELGASRDSVLLQAKEAMSRTLKEIWKQREPKLPFKDIHEMLIMASIIEKETGIADERSMVASVFVNRLKKGMRLQTDPTVIYAVTEGESDFGRKISKADLQYDSPYNTYKYYGLPPGPICNPGIESLRAAVNPADTNFLYFVADGKGGHNFAKSLNEHNSNVKDYRGLRK